MLRFLSKLARPFHTATRASAPRRAPRRAWLGLEGLEDRMVLSTTAGAIQIGHTLSVTVLQPNDTITFTGDKHHGQLDVVEHKPIGKPILLGHFPIKSINQVDVNLVGNDAVRVDDSRGYPFAKGTTFTVAGTSPGNSLTLTGSATLKGPLANELYLPGSPGFDATLFLAPPASLSGPFPGTRYQIDTTTSLTDSFKTTGTLDVQTHSGNLSLSGSNGVTQTLSGLSAASGAGDTLTYSNKSLVQLDVFEEGNGTLTLGATAAAAGEKTFTLQLNNSAVNDVVFIDATPGNVTTNVTVNGTGSFVNLLANSGPVSVQGIGAPSLALGDANGTAGIQANVNVQGARQLVVDDTNNTTTQENVRVTESTISGTGLFGNSAAVVDYSNIGKLQFFAGQKFEKYIIDGSTATAAFSTPIEIDGSANGSLFVDVVAESNSNLHVVVHNASKADNSADLVFVALGAAISPSRALFSDSGAPIFSGGAEATFFNGGHSTVAFSDFSEVLPISHF
jgi:hypothetical protein